MSIRGYCKKCHRSYGNIYKHYLRVHGEKYSKRAEKLREVFPEKTEEKKDEFVPSTEVEEIEREVFAPQSAPIPPPSEPELVESVEAEVPEVREFVGEKLPGFAEALQGIHQALNQLDGEKDFCEDLERLRSFHRVVERWMSAKGYEGSPDAVLGLAIAGMYVMPITKKIKRFVERQKQRKIIEQQRKAAEAAQVQTQAQIQTQTQQV